MKRVHPKGGIIILPTKKNEMDDGIPYHEGAVRYAKEVGVYD
jgi:hypothetical protein